MESKCLARIIHSYTILLQIAILVDLASSQLSIPTCNAKLQGRKIIVHGLRWESRDFRLFVKTSHTLQCSHEEAQTTFQILNPSQLQVLRDKLSHANEDMKLNLSATDTYFNKDGSLGIVIEGDHHYFDREDYCIVNDNNGWMDIKYCKPSCEGNSPCIVKCCPYDETFNPRKENCEETEENVKWSPFLYHDEYASKPSNRSKFSPHYIYYLLSPRCPSVNLESFYSRALTIDTIYGKSSNEKYPFKVLEDGSLAYITNRRRWEKQPKQDDEHFCVDAIQGYDLKIKSTGLESEQILFNCAIVPLESNISAVYMVSMYVASVFLLLTCIVYLLLWDKQNVHGWTVFSLVSSMFMWFIFMGTAHLLGLLTHSPELDEDEHMNLTENSYNYSSNSTYESFSTFEEDSHEFGEHSNESHFGQNSNQLFADDESDSLYCTINAILAHFFFLSTFCWLTFINLDLFLTFKTLSSVAGRSKGFKKFATYACLSWGLPLIVVTIGIVLDHQFPDSESLVLTPEYGKAYCFVTPSAQGVYLYFIITVLLIINFILVGTTFYFLYSVKKLTGSVRFILVAKLSVVMGVTWSFEVISWAVTSEQDHTAWYWVVTDMYNLFQAILIFKIFAFKRTIMAQLEQKYPIFKDIFDFCGCTKFVSYLSKIKRSGVSGTEASTGNTQSTDNESNWNKGRVALNSSENGKSTDTNNDSEDHTIPTLKSFEKSESSASPLLAKVTSH